MFGLTREGKCQRAVVLCPLLYGRRKEIPHCGRSSTDTIGDVYLWLNVFSKVYKAQIFDKMYVHLDIYTPLELVKNKFR